VASAGLSSCSPNRARSRAVLPATLLLGGLAGLLLYGVIPWSCPVALLLRIPCPGCGLTRATRLALHGDLAGATHLHPLWFVVVPAVMLAAVVELRGYLRDGRFGAVERSRVGSGITAVIAGLLVIVWLARFCGALGGPVSI
jgi:hypothetical protein